MLLIDNARPFYVSAATATTHTLVPAVTGKRIFIWRLFLWSAGAVNVNFEDGTTDLGGTLALAAQSNIHLPLNNGPLFFPWFITTSGNAFGMTLSGAVGVNGYGLYSAQ